MIKYDLMKTKSQSDPKPHTEQIFPVPVPVPSIEGGIFRRRRFGAGQLGAVPFRRRTFGHRFELGIKNNEADNSLNAVERKPVPTRVLNPNVSEASYKPKQRSYRKTN